MGVTARIFRELATKEKMGGLRFRFPPPPQFGRKNL